MEANRFNKNTIYIPHIKNFISMLLFGRLNKKYMVMYAGHVAQIGKLKMCMQLSFENRNVTGHLEDLQTDAE